MMANLFLGRDAFIDFSISVTGISLIIPVLFWLYFGERECAARTGNKIDQTTNVLFWLIIIPLGILIAPGSNLFIQKMIGSVPLREAMIAVPTAMATVYAYIHLTKRLHITGKKRISAVLCLSLLIAIASSIPIRYAYPLGFKLVSNSMKIDPEVQEICEKVGSDYVLLPKNILGQVGEFDSGVNAVPAADITFEETKAQTVAQKATELDVASVVIKNSYDDPEIFESQYYKKTAETEHYVIYQRSDE